MATRGQPTKYKAEYAAVARKVTEIGGTLNELAEALSVSVATVKNWGQKYPDFLASIKEGRELQDAWVEKALLSRAKGMKIRETQIGINADGSEWSRETIKEIPPDTAAAFIWLKNRQPKDWRDKKEITGEDGEPITIKIVNA